MTADKNAPTQSAKTDGPFDVIIAGGGLAGLTLALALESVGLNILVVDPNKSPEIDDGRVSAISAGGMAMMDALGVRAQLGPAQGNKIQEIKGMEVADARPGFHLTPNVGAKDRISPLSLSFDPTEGDQSNMGCMVENNAMRAALATVAATKSNISQILGAKIMGHHRGAAEVSVTLDNGQEALAKLLVAADGRASGVRARENIRDYGWAYDQHAFVATINHSGSHDDKAIEYFLPDGPIAFLPFGPNRSNVIWSTAPKKVAALIAGGPALQQEALSAHMPPSLGEITSVGHAHSHPLALHVTAEWTRPRMALLGDAAHGIHPIAGQGFNLAIKDIAALAEVLFLAKARGQDIGDAIVLEDYARWRRTDSVTMALACDSFVRLFSNNIGPVRAIRAMGLGLMEKLGPARVFFMKNANGQFGDVPQLLRGELLAN